MTYALSAHLQTAIYDRLLADPAVTAELGADVYDAVPSGSVPALYAVIGEEKASERSDITSAGAEHEVKISVLTSDAGFSRAKRAAGAICDALVGAPLTLARGRVVGVTFRKAEAARDTSNSIRRVDLNFRIRVEDI